MQTSRNIPVALKTRTNCQGTHDDQSLKAGPAMEDQVPNLVVNSFIAAIHALGVLCSEVGDILRDLAKNRGTSAGVQMSIRQHEPKAASLNPADWIRGEEDEEYPAG
jgi:hypothetical protein